MFEFTIPTESAPQSPRSLAVSLAVHGVAILLLFAIRFSAASKFPTAPEHFTLLAPARETPQMPPPIRTPRPREFHPAPPAPARLEVADVPIVKAPAIDIPKPVPEIAHMAIPVVIIAPVIKPAEFSEPKPVTPAPKPPAPKPVMKAAGFESSESAAAGPARGSLTAPGSFESAHSTGGAPVRSAIPAQGGFSDTSIESSSSSRRSAVRSAAFGDSAVEKSAAAPRQTTIASRLTPVVILSKPRPAYTAEARAAKIEGEVLIEVQFSVSGEVRVLRVMRGLGHGLDETAVAAAEGIRFRPATREGAAVDSTALVHIVFQIAD